VHKEQSSVEITSREQACRVQMCKKQGLSAQGTVKHGNNQQGSKHAGYKCAGNQDSVCKEQSSIEITMQKGTNAGKEQGTDIYFQCKKLSKQVFHTVFAVSRK
jgi:hypothetical protein